MSYLTKSGDLVITANNAWRQELAILLKEEEGTLSAEQALFAEPEYVKPSRYATRGCFFLDLVRPDQIGVPTNSPILAVDSPILAEVLEMDPETGELTDIGRVFWFPDYQIRDPMAELARTGRVVFQAAPDSSDGKAV